MTRKKTSLILVSLLGIAAQTDTCTFGGTGERTVNCPDGPCQGTSQQEADGGGKGEDQEPPEQPGSGLGFAVIVTPEAKRVARAGRLELQAEVTLPSPAPEPTFGTVSWTIAEGATGGSIIQHDSAAKRATYTAPSTPGTYHVIARSVDDPTAFAVAVITVAPISIRIEPEVAIARALDEVQFVADVTGTDDRRIVWSIETGALPRGHISNTGRYIAPPEVDTAGHPFKEVRIRASSVADLNVFELATVRLAESADTVTVSICPGSTTVETGEVVRFDALVKNPFEATETAVTWSAHPVPGQPTGGGRFEGQMFYAGLEPGVLEIRATSDFDPDKYASAMVRVVEPLSRPIVGRIYDPTNGDGIIYVGPDNDWQAGTVALDAPGPYRLRGTAPSSERVLRAFKDVNGNGVWDPVDEPTAVINLGAYRDVPQVFNLTLAEPADQTVPGKLEQIKVGSWTDGSSSGLVVRAANAFGRPVVERPDTVLLERRDDPDGPWHSIAVTQTMADFAFGPAVESGTWFVRATPQRAGLSGPPSDVTVFDFDGQSQEAQVSINGDVHYTDSSHGPRGAIYVVAESIAANSIYAVKLVGSGQVQAFSLSLPPGAYVVQAAEDSDGDGVIEPGDARTIDPKTFVLDGEPVTNLILSLVSSGTHAVYKTEHRSGGLAIEFGLIDLDSPLLSVTHTDVSPASLRSTLRLPAEMQRRAWGQFGGVGAFASGNVPVPLPASSALSVDVSTGNADVCKTRSYSVPVSVPIAVPGGLRATTNLNMGDEGEVSLDATLSWSRVPEAAGYLIRFIQNDENDSREIGTEYVSQSNASRLEVTLSDIEVSKFETSISGVVTAFRSDGHSSVSQIKKFHIMTPPDAEARTEDGHVVVSFTPSHPTARYEMTVDGRRETFSGASTEVRSTQTLPAGSDHPILLKAIDPDGNSVTGTVTVDVPLMPSTISTTAITKYSQPNIGPVTEPQVLVVANMELAPGTFLTNVKIVDPEGEFPTYQTNTEATETLSLTLKPPTPGPHLLRFKIEDHSGNWLSVSKGFRVIGGPNALIRATVSEADEILFEADFEPPEGTRVTSIAVYDADNHQQSAALDADGLTSPVSELSAAMNESAVGHYLLFVSEDGDGNASHTPYSLSLPPAPYAVVAAHLDHSNDHGYRVSVDLRTSPTPVYEILLRDESGAVLPGVAPIKATQPPWLTGQIEFEDLSILPPSGTVLIKGVDEYGTTRESAIPYSVVQSPGVIAHGSRMDGIYGASGFTSFMILRLDTPQPNADVVQVDILMPDGRTHVAPISVPYPVSSYSFDGSGVAFHVSENLSGQYIAMVRTVDRWTKSSRVDMASFYLHEPPTGLIHDEDDAAPGFSWSLPEGVSVQRQSFWLRKGELPHPAFSGEPPDLLGADDHYFQRYTSETGFQGDVLDRMTDYTWAVEVVDWEGNRSAAAAAFRLPALSAPLITKHRTEIADTGELIATVWFEPPTDDGVHKIYLTTEPENFEGSEGPPPLDPERVLIAEAGTMLSSPSTISHPTWPEGLPVYIVVGSATPHGWKQAVSQLITVDEELPSLSTIRAFDYEEGSWTHTVTAEYGDAPENVYEIAVVGPSGEPVLDANGDVAILVNAGDEAIEPSIAFTLASPELAELVVKVRDKAGNTRQSRLPFSFHVFSADADASGVTSLNVDVLGKTFAVKMMQPDAESAYLEAITIVDTLTNTAVTNTVPFIDEPIDGAVLMTSHHVIALPSTMTPGTYKLIAHYRLQEQLGTSLQVQYSQTMTEFVLLELPTLNDVSGGFSDLTFSWDGPDGSGIVHRSIYLRFNASLPHNGSLYDVSQSGLPADSYQHEAGVPAGGDHTWMVELSDGTGNVTRAAAEFSLFE